METVCPTSDDLSSSVSLVPSLIRTPQSAPVRESENSADGVRMTMPSPEARTSTADSATDAGAAERLSFCFPQPATRKHDASRNVTARQIGRGLRCKRPMKGFTPRGVLSLRISGVVLRSSSLRPKLPFFARVPSDECTYKGKKKTGYEINRKQQSLRRG